MKTQPCSPDVLIVHQMSGTSQAAQFANFIQDILLGLCDSAVSEADPEHVVSP